LQVAHPTIRRHLDEVEAAIGVPLFARSSTGLVPTQLALELRSSAEVMEAAAETFVRTASSEASSVTGTVRITASEVLSGEILPPMLADLKVRHPGLAFELVATNNIEDLMRLDADIAVRMTRPEQGELIATQIGTISVGFFAHERWLRVNTAPMSLHELVRGGSLIGQDRQTALIRGLDALGVKAHRSDFAFRSDSDLAQLAALRSGLGIGLCQVAIAQREPHLSRILPEFGHDLEVWLTTSPNVRRAVRVSVTVEALKSGLRNYVQR
jgi:DNA-binding transcriptional LysR family regulator